ncbi:D-alanyl-D-alanine carboxypeptidase [Patulibacter brassicae]|jgi:D-alanyl-D-alanine carboxypeptidase/D-alanyl-D-alanine-endopeptidase (penicillin-binding protein 4)|uniref:D-alanyl-D-alanine carboxypeptidase n=1 Tax=Patulibacter brassicae TaxID=1705717 RepID=A0ABU4VM73_9ACTN|nr:D-alanyl-D-alanine carboxypeptidase [Patulibacter brassicae]MDX8152923.1 D-alanyl-D-alanine carboxypeptidase [Patulibacter brassicae]
MLGARRPTTVLPRAIVAVLAALALGLAIAAAPAPAAMPSTSGLGGRSGVLVVDLRTGKTLLQRQASTRRIPASVTKLFTVTTALRTLGPGWAPRTRVLATGAAEGDAWRGNLYLVGGGDPTLSRTGLRALAQQTARALGVRTLHGKVLADASAFDDWQGGDRTGRHVDGDMGGRIGALVLDRGSGQPDPARRAASVFRSALGSAGVAVTGALGARGAPSTATQVAVLRGPTLAQLAGSILVPSDNFQAEMLLKAVFARDGVEGACRVAAGLEPVPDEPQTDVDRPCVEQATAAAPSTLASAIVRERATLRAYIGSTPSLRDGSGLTRRNRVSPLQVVRLLQRANGDLGLGPTLRAALPQAGRTGTLARRMRGTAAVGRCQAKTGTINGVSALAGFCRTIPGRDVAFAILQNGVSPASARSAQDRFVAALAARG